MIGCRCWPGYTGEYQCADDAAGVCLCLDCHEFSSAPSHAQACKRLSVRSTQPASAQHSPRVRCQIRKERESGSAPKMRHVRGSAANHSGSSPGSPWHRQLARSRRSLTFSASAAAHALSAAPALGGHPAGFLTSLSTAAVPRSCPASRTTPQPVAASRLHAPATQGPPQGREARHHVTLCQHCTAHAHGLSSPVSSILCR